MAYLAAVNPWVLSYAGNEAPARQQMPAEDSKTWVLGQLGYVETSGGTVTPVTASGLADDVTYVQFEETQASSTSTSTVWVRVIPKGTLLAIFVQTGGTEGAITQTAVGSAYGLENIGSITYLDLGTTSGRFRVEQLGSTWNPVLAYRYTLNGGTDEAGLCTVRLI